MINERYFKIFALSTLIAGFTACNSATKSPDTAPKDTASTSTVTEQKPSSGIDEFKEFDWSKVPPSSAKIGSFPFLTAPSGFIIVDKGGLNGTKLGYSDFKDFSKLIVYNGSSFYNAEGKVAKLKFKMEEQDADWNQYKFDSSVEKYLTSIGARLIGKLKVSDAQKSFLNKDDDMTIYNHIIGDPYNEAVRFYALNHSSGKIMFQIWSNTSEAAIGVVQLEAFEQTIKSPTASQMKSDIAANGKAILNINFDTDKSTLQPDGKKVADEIFILLKNNSTLKIAIEGHTDNAGSADHNKKLASDRANTILKFLTDQGIASSRLTAVGYGAERPLVANDSEANKAQNRRVELVKR